MTEDQKKWFRDGGCLKCEKKGHYAKDCKGITKQVNMVKKEEPPHKNIAWTDCYDNNCYDHKEEKKKANWFPKQPPKRKESRQVNMTKNLTETCLRVSEVYTVAPFSCRTCTATTRYNRR